MRRKTLINKGPIRQKEAEIGMLFIKACGFFVKAFWGAKKASGLFLGNVYKRLF